MQNPDTLHIETLKGDWCDKDIVLLHACFQLLKDCVEKENLVAGHTNWDYDEEHKNAKKEIEQLYNWWKGRSKIEAVKAINDLDKQQYNEDTEMLIRLIKIRQYLWA